MKNLKKGLLTGIILALLVGLAACGDSDSKDTDTKKDDASASGQVEKIKKRGKLQVGIKTDVPKFGFENPDTKKYEGMEVEIAKLIAKEITGNADNVDFKGVTAQSRGPLLDNGEVDMILATFTITPERKKEYNFSEPYYKDEIGFLVRKEDKLKNIEDLDGKIVGVAQAATTKNALQEQEKEKGFTFKEYKEFASYPELKTALTSKRIDAFAVDKSILYGYVDDKTEIMDDGFSPQEYGVATKKDNTELADYVNDLIKKWKSDGTLEKIISEQGLKSAE